MKRIAVILILIILTVSLSSCFISNLISYPGSDDKLMRDCADELFEAVKSKDSELVKSSFSIYVKSADGFSGSVDKLISYIQGGVISWKEVSSPVCFDSSGENGRIKKLSFWYTLTTDKEEYRVYFCDVPTDTYDENNKGIHSLLIIKKDEENKLTGTIEDWASYEGISIPFYDTEIKDA
jgi:hypothetical protein